MFRFFSGVLLVVLLTMMAAGSAAAQDATEVSGTEVPATEAVPTEAPATEVPATEAPPIEPPPEEEPGALVIGAALCPEGLSGEQIDPAACSEPAAGIEFYAANPNTDNVAFGATGGDGLVGFPLDQFAIGGPEGAPVEIGMVLGSNPYGAVFGTVVGCTLNGAPVEVGMMDSGVQPGGATLAFQTTVQPGDQLACEWYLSHGEPGDRDDDDADDGQRDVTPAAPVTQLPSTGSGAAGEVDRAAGIVTGAMVLTVLAGAALRVTRRAGEVATTDR